MASDFAFLFSQLGLRSDCTLSEFKHACRRRIGDLHPDRAGATTASQASLSLDTLLVLYAEVLDFHRRYGRLPGAPVPHADMTPTPTPAPAVRRPAAGARGYRPQPRAVAGIAVVALAAALLFVVAGVRQEAAPPVRNQAARPPVVADTPPGEDALLEVGMDADSVRAIQGEPLRDTGLEWEYGPSWLRFEEDRLVDWHSSPLHPLRTATPAPPIAP